MDFFDEDEDYFGANEYLIPGETRDGKFIAFYEEGLFSSTNPHPEYISLEQNRKHEHQSPTKHYCECYGYSSHPFSVKHETTCCKKPAVHVVSDPLERSHKAATGHCIPSHMTTEMPCSVLSQHLDSSLFPNEFPVNLLSEMLQLQDFSELDPQLAELEKKDTVQRKQENNRKKSRLLLKQQGKSCGSMNSRDFMELYKIRRPSGSKDRHTKVATSRGPRDRRMRLSVETAIKFFDVQDRLGFDQPGKAIEWLILKSRSAIDQLPAISSSPLDISSGRRTSLDSLLPSLDRHTDSTREDFITNTEENIGGVDSLSPSLSTEPSIVQQHYWSRRKIKNPRKSNTKTAALKTPRRWRHDTSLKEIRSKARERARERTRERTKHKLITSGNTTSASQDMSRTRAVELEAFNLHETTISASSPTICKESMNASGKHLYCDASTMKFGLLEKSLIRVFHHDGSLLPAQDSVKEIAGNLHLSGNSNPSFSDSQSQIQSSVQTVAQPEDRRIQSTGSFSGLCSSKFSLTSCLFPQTVTSMNGDFQSKSSDVSVDYSLLQPPSIRACTQPSVSASNHEHRSIIL